MLLRILCRYIHSGNIIVEMGAILVTGMQVIQGKKISKESILGSGAGGMRDIPEKYIRLEVR